MRRESIGLYLAPGTKAPLEIVSVKSETDEIREGTLRCTVSGREYQVKAGAPILIEPSDMSASMVKDQQLIELADRHVDNLIATGTLPQELKNRGKAYGQGLKANTELLFTLFEGVPKGKKLLEIGAGDTKLSARFAKLGFQVVALDFAGYRLCSTADRYMSQGEYFERVVGLMANLPFKDDTFDVVFMHATLHHALPLDHSKFEWCNPSNMIESLSEIGRVMKRRVEGGVLVLAGEGVYPEGTPVEARHYEAAAKQSGFYESWYEMSEYEAQFAATGVWPNLWTNQESFQTFAYGYLENGDRFSVIEIEDGIHHQSSNTFLTKARRLDEIMPPWVSIQPLVGKMGLIVSTERNTGTIIDALVRNVYRGVLNREAEPRGVEIYGNAMRDGMPLSALIAELIETPEFRSRPIETT